MRWVGYLARCAQTAAAGGWHSGRLPLIVLFTLKPQGSGIDAVALAGRFRPVGKNVP